MPPTLSLNVIFGISGEALHFIIIIVVGSRVDCGRLANTELQ